MCGCTIDLYTLRFCLFCSVKNHSILHWGKHYWDVFTYRDAVKQWDTDNTMDWVKFNQSRIFSEISSNIPALTEVPQGKLSAYAQRCTWKSSAIIDLKEEKVCIAWLQIKLKALSLLEHSITIVAPKSCHLSGYVKSNSSMNQNDMICLIYSANASQIYMT